MGASPFWKRKRDEKQDENQEAHSGNRSEMKSKRQNKLKHGLNDTKHKMGNDALNLFRIIEMGFCEEVHWQQQNTFPPKLLPISKTLPEFYQLGSS